MYVKLSHIFAVTETACNLCTTLESQKKTRVAEPCGSHWNDNTDGRYVKDEKRKWNEPGSILKNV